MSMSADERPAASASAGVTIVTQTRVHPEHEDRFAQWQQGTSEAIARFPGFIQQSVMPPKPPAQLDWVILQHFAGAAAAKTWLGSQERQDRLAAAQEMLLGCDDVHLVLDGGPGVLPAPVSVVISTRIKSGSEAAYRAWEQRIAAAQLKAKGFQGYRFEPPIQGVQEDWLAILRFDSETNLQAWLDSPERRRLLEEAKPFTEEFHSRIALTGFDQWFAGSTGAALPPVWKQNMLVLLMLYPVVFLFGIFVQGPVLSNRAHLPFAVALFIGNVASILLLNYLVPWVSRRFSWWLQPAGKNPARIATTGGFVVLALYAAMVVVFAISF